MIRTAAFVPRVLVVAQDARGPNAGVGGTRRLCEALRRSGIAVVRSTLRGGPAQVAAQAVRDGADVVVLSIAEGDHLEVGERLRDALARLGSPDLPVIMTGEIPRADWPLLAEQGVRRVFERDAAAPEIAAFVHWLLEPKAFVAGYAGLGADGLA